MIKHIIKFLVLMPALAVFLFCSAGSDDTMKVKESIMAFELTNIPYPVSFANFQRNSFVPVGIKSKWKPSWTKFYSALNENLVITPHMVYLSNGLIGLRCESEMLILDRQGNLKYQMPLSASGGPVFGDTALAYFIPSHQLIMMDYEFNQIGDASVIPELNENSFELLMKPTLDNILAVVQFTGGPMRDPKQYFVYDYNWAQKRINWFNEYENVIYSALLTNDSKTIVLLKFGEVILINAEDGQIIKSYKPDFGFPLKASLDKNDNLLIIAERTIDDKTGLFLVVYTLKNKELWSFPLNEPNENMPPACDKDGRVYVIDGLQLNCFKNGELDWMAVLKPAERNYLTITADNHAVVLNGSLLALYAPNGEKLFERLITNTEEKFFAPPVIDEDGHVYVAGQNALYCFE